MTLAIDKIVAEGALMLVNGQDQRDIEAYIASEMKNLSDMERRTLGVEGIALRVEEAIAEEAA